ncbi:DEAD/DEAH box helicase [Criblamydia sequanensis]|uniref:DEAD/DEAH box helicase n=1 Tax=Candidatus Criblamydia sequanensis TaxID=340071 RepID=UPI0013783232|nr:DEAD/DEAH box helicase [Criblamydia sequanensis]
MSQFAQFNLNELIMKTLEEIGFSTPTPIQEKAIPHVLEGKDVIACAETGTGKTAAFMLPLLHRLEKDKEKKSSPQVLVLVPTRELAIQLAEQAKKFCRHLPFIKTACIYGGIPYPVQKKALSQRYQILVATPGRLIDHLERGRINLSQVEYFILDEADRMLDMGFIPAVEAISELIPAKRQTLLFSATIDGKIAPIAKKLLKNPVEIRVNPASFGKECIDQKLYYVDNLHHKVQLLEHILKQEEVVQAIVFTSTIIQAKDLSRNLIEKGYYSDTLHGDLSQRERTRTINKLKRGDIDVLIATDVAARGIDISTVTHVVNFDLPFKPEDFIHRIGRTGRAGREGFAITFAAFKESLAISKINKLLGKPIVLSTIVGLEPKGKPLSLDDKSQVKPRSSRSRRFGNTRQRDRSDFSSDRPKRERPSRPRDSDERSDFSSDRPKRERPSRPRDSDERSDFSSDRPKRERPSRPRDSDERSDFSSDRPKRERPSRPRDSDERSDFSSDRPKRERPSRPRDSDERSDFSSDRPKRERPSRPRDSDERSDFSSDRPKRERPSRPRDSDERSDFSSDRPKRERPSRPRDSDERSDFSSDRPKRERPSRPRDSDERSEFSRFKKSDESRQRPERSEKVFSFFDRQENSSRNERSNVSGNRFQNGRKPSSRFGERQGRPGANSNRKTGAKKSFNRPSYRD